MKKIAIMGLVDWENYGEQFLAKSVAHLVGDQYTHKFIDFERINNKIGYLFYGIMVVLTRLFPTKKKPHFLILLGVRVLAKRHYKKELQGCDALIFACGSYKYTTQKLWAYYAVAVDVADKMGISVMYNAMNIQNYDEMDWRCQRLKEYTNRPCVKVFTTRDGEEGLRKLQKYYLEKEDIKSFMVGDPAFWIPECYKITRNKQADKIGVNLIRGKIFADYGYSITEEQLIDIYCELIRKLDEAGLEWELFTNGLEVDYLLGTDILKRCNKSDREIVVPQSDKQLVELIANYKAIVGARLHASICAYSLDVPLVGFIWDEKLLRFAQIAGLEDMFLTETELSGVNLYNKLLQSFDYKYDIELRDTWKGKTQETIQQFLDETCNKCSQVV